jgi:DNA (cytosine-5)-methyltransferase 1
MTTKQTDTKKLRVATVFSGIESFEHAFRMNIEHEIVFASDIDNFCKQTYFANYNIKEEQWYNDVFHIDGKKYHGKVDMLVGGSPCQSFSMVGKRKGLKDDRGNLIFEYIRLIKDIDPKVFIFENVKGLLNHEQGETWKYIEKSFKNLGYSIKYQVLNAKDYGIPQNRERIFLVGFKDKNIDFEFPKPVKLEITMQDLLENNPDSKYYLGEKGVNFVTKEKNITKRYTQINGNIALCQKANQQFNWHGDFILEKPKNDVEDKYYLSDKVKDYVLKTGTKNFYSKPETDLPVARPLLQSMHKMHRAGVDNYITKGEKIRKLTPRECHRLMGFSDKFKIVVSDTQAYRQAGNSIVAPVLIELMKKILPHI